MRAYFLLYDGDSYFAVLLILPSCIFDLVIIMQSGRLSIMRIVRYSSFLDSTTAIGTSVAIDNSSNLLEEQCGSRNTQVVSRLTERHRLLAEGRLPPVTYEWEKELWAKRERFGMYGLASGVNPAELWPTVEAHYAFTAGYSELPKLSLGHYHLKMKFNVVVYELIISSDCSAEIQEEEAIGWYMKYSDILKVVENAKKSQHAATLARLEEVAALEDKYPEMLKEFLENRKEIIPIKSKQEIEAEQRAKDMLEYYGYEILPNDPRFPILFEKMTEAKKKKIQAIKLSEKEEISLKKRTSRRKEKEKRQEKKKIHDFNQECLIMSNTSSVGMQQQQYSIVEYIGYNQGGSCGYCHREGASPASIGILFCSQKNVRCSHGVMGYHLSCEHFNQLLDRGCNRSGKYLYKPVIANTCCPQYTIRPSERPKILEYNTAKKTPDSSTISSNSQAQRIRQEKEQFRRRTLKSFIIRLVDSNSSEFYETFKESFKLYEKYQTNVHHDSRCNRTGYRNFLADSPLFNDEKDESKSVALGSYHQQYYLDNRLIAVGVVDILPRCLSAKYLYYDPDFEFLTLGTYTALREIAFTQELAKERPQLHYYYMGFYIHSCQKMRYKERFHPSDLLCDRSFTWVPLEKCLEMMERCGERIEAFAPDAPIAEKCPVETVLPYRILLTLSDFNETETFMEEYAQSSRGGQNVSDTVYIVFSYTFYLAIPVCTSSSLSGVIIWWPFQKATPMWTLLSFLSLITIHSLSLLTQATNGPVQRRFEYKHSFRAPDLSLRDGTIPFWSIIGDAVASREQLRLAPSMRSRRGLAWNKRVMAESDHFEIQVAFRITGQGRIGADGIAVWYTAQQPILGPVFGANDYWTGMGLFLDSFDNDAQKNNPFVALMINDGTRQYDHQTDGSQQMLSGCQKDFRNKPYPVHLKIEYLHNVLTVSLSDGLQAVPRYELCIRSENIFLPKMGISAATGGLADDHDIIEYSVFSLYTDRAPAPSALPQEEKQKYDAEFERQMKEYEKERQRFKEEHPEKAKPDTLDEEIAEVYEDASQREMRMILEMQTNIHQILQHLESRLQDISRQQSIQSSMLQQCAAKTGGAASVGPGEVAGNAGGFQQHEKNEALQSLRDLISNVRDMKSYMNEIFTRTYNLEQKIGSAMGSPSGITPDPALQSADPALRSLVETIQNDVRQIRTTQLGTPSAQIVGGNCPNMSCLSSSFFVTVIFAQSAVIIIVLWIK
ncbi:Protein ERGIC-53 [Dirofilaria immitis]|nr:Protein ERGIC-53 [Dirofilaria immitis]